jgi:hypothetical protein
MCPGPTTYKYKIYKAQMFKPDNSLLHICFHEVEKGHSTSLDAKETYE